MMDKLLLSSLLSCHLNVQFVPGATSSLRAPENSSTKDKDVFKCWKLPIIKFQSSRQEITPGAMESMPNSKRNFNISM